ncbi:MAG: hypothetical protein KDB06_07020 [Ilumatobacter sp.]|nr:hypothetical protein [Ilumatobacter sp.]MCB0984388.1 hypothetical protein [Ilumatobacter sp.]
MGIVAWVVDGSVAGTVDSMVVVTAVVSLAPVVGVLVDADVPSPPHAARRTTAAAKPLHLVVVCDAAMRFMTHLPFIVRPECCDRVALTWRLGHVGC